MVIFLLFVYYSVETGHCFVFYFQLFLFLFTGYLILGIVY